MANDRKDYGYLHLTRAKKKDGAEYIEASLKARVIKPTGLNTLDSGKAVLNFRAPLADTNGAFVKYIETMCGKKPTVGSDGAIWIQCSAWDNEPGKGVATRLSKLLAKMGSVPIQLHVDGAFDVVESNTDGKTYFNAQLTIYDFYMTWKGKENGDSAGSSAPASQQGTPQGQAAPAPSGEFAELEDLDDGDLPF